jgi:hypothetical protein
MNTIQGATNYAGLLPVEPPDEPPSVRPTTLENDRPPNGQPSRRKRASRALSLFLVAFCLGVAATLAWQSYGDTARQIIANSYPQVRWLAPQAKPVAQSAPNMIVLAAPATPSFDQQQLTAMSLDLGAVRRSIDRIAAGQEQIREQITHSTDQIATSVSVGQEQITRSIDQITISVAAGQEQTTRSIDQITTNQEKITRSIDQTATSMAQAPSAKVSGITVESRAHGASLQPTERLNTKPTEARPSQALPERGKQLAAASRPDSSCFPSASAVLQNHPGVWPSWTLRTPGHEGTVCWYAATRPKESDHRPRASDHRNETTPMKEMVGTTENRPSTPYAPAPE